MSVSEQLMFIGVGALMGAAALVGVLVGIGLVRSGTRRWLREYWRSR